MSHDILPEIRFRYLNITYLHSLPSYQESVAGSVIQATGTVEFEDGLWIGNHLTVQNGLQRVCIIPGVQPGAVHTPGSYTWVPPGEH